MCHCDLPEMFTERRHVSRRTRRCEECRHPIAAGETYVLSKGKWDGSFDSFDTCLFCWHLRGLAQLAQDDCDCIAFGELFEWLMNEAYEYHRGDEADAVVNELCAIFGEKPRYESEAAE